jgi:hypothetical protein
MFSSSPTTRRLSWAAIACSLGPFRSACSIFSPSFAITPNGLPTPSGASLLGALAYFGIDAVGATEKKEMQAAIGSGTWEGRFEPEAILDYCEADVDALARLLSVMLPRIDLPRALLRGRYMAAAAAMEHAGVPIDAAMLARLRHGWTAVQDQLIAAIDRDYGVYEGRTFKPIFYSSRMGVCNNPLILLRSRGRLR